MNQLRWPVATNDDGVESNGLDGIICFLFPFLPSPQVASLKAELQEAQEKYAQIDKEYAAYKLQSARLLSEVGRINTRSLNMEIKNSNYFF